MKIAITILQLLCGLAIILIVLLQSGKSEGLSGAIGGVADSFLAKNKAKTIDAKLARATKWFGAVFLILTLILLISLPLWKRPQSAQEDGAARALSLREIVRIRGAKEVMLCFFCYCALEQTAGLWAGSYLVLTRGVDAETAASFAGLYFIGITAGRAVNGFMTLRFSDRSLVRAGEVLIAVGTLMLFLPAQKVALAGFVLLGIGSAPIYPSIIHSTPAHFGAERSQAIIGVQMASAYVGTCLMPPLFGLLAGYIGAWLLPVYIAALLALMAVMFERLEKKTSKPA